MLLSARITPLHNQKVDLLKELTGRSAVDLMEDVFIAYLDKLDIHRCRACDKPILVGVLEPIQAKAARTNRAMCSNACRASAHRKRTAANQKAKDKRLRELEQLLQATHKPKP